MSLIRWEPFGDMDALFGRLVQNGFANGGRLALGGNNQKLDWAPSADISETEKEYVIRAELPAVKKEDVQVTYEDGIMTIKGERKQQKDEKGEKFHRVWQCELYLQKRGYFPDYLALRSAKSSSRLWRLCRRWDGREAPGATSR